MHKRMTISINEAVYDGLVSIGGRRKINQFLEDLTRPHVVNDDLISGYQAMAADTQRKALKWSNAINGPVSAMKK